MPAQPVRDCLLLLDVPTPPLWSRLEAGGSGLGEAVEDREVVFTDQAASRQCVKMLSDERSEKEVWQAVLCDDVGNVTPSVAKRVPVDR